MEIQHPKALASVTVHKTDSTKRIAITAFFAVLYAIVLNFVISTSGEPYQLALEEAQVFLLLCRATSCVVLCCLVIVLSCLVT
jgi:hypothetical protein